MMVHPSSENLDADGGMTQRIISALSWAPSRARIALSITTKIAGHRNRPAADRLRVRNDLSLVDSGFNRDAIFTGL
jgi:hypothetical protein